MSDSGNCVFLPLLRKGLFASPGALEGRAKTQFHRLLLARHVYSNALGALCGSVRRPITFYFHTTR